MSLRVFRDGQKIQQRHATLLSHSFLLYISASGIRNHVQMTLAVSLAPYFLILLIETPPQPLTIRDMVAEKHVMCRASYKHHITCINTSHHSIISSNHQLNQLTLLFLYTISFSFSIFLPRAFSPPEFIGRWVLAYYRFFLRLLSIPIVLVYTYEHVHSAADCLIVRIASKDSIQIKNTEQI